LNISVKYHQNWSL